MKKIFYLSLMIIVLVSSCTFEEGYSFKSDWSGSYEASLDLSGIADMAGEENEYKEMIPSDEIANLEGKMNAIEGISNAKVVSDNLAHSINFFYDFDGLPALNRLNNINLDEDDNESPLGALGKWEMRHKGKKKFFITMIPKEVIEDAQEMEKAKEAGEMLQVTTFLNFSREIKDINSDVATKGVNENQVIIKYSGKDLIDATKNWDTEIKLR
ncbi:MAG: hypothetical protein ACI888_000814 [Flavobacteriales bacterium]|jgi:hypothetical protein|tara:strand:- start:1177 stop:1815 length:639 start_codon:yes stop_codon:yes gene_type:complete